MVSEILKDGEARMKQVIASTNAFGGIRTGRANQVCWTG